MKKLLFVLMIPLMFSLHSCEKKCDIAEETGKVQMLLERYIIANETKDIDLVHQIWAPDADIVVFGTDGDEKLIGWEAIKSAVLVQFESFEEVYISTYDQKIKINSHGNTGWFSEIVDYNYTFDGKAYSYEGIRFTGVVEKRGDDWYVVQSHMSIPAGSK